MMRQAWWARGYRVVLATALFVGVAAMAGCDDSRSDLDVAAREREMIANHNGDPARISHELLHAARRVHEKSKEEREFKKGAYDFDGDMQAETSAETFVKEKHRWYRAFQQYRERYHFWRQEITRRKEATGEKELLTFAEEKVPEVQKAIIKLEQEIAIRRRNLDAMTFIMRQQGLDPANDMHCNSRLKAIDDMQKSVNELMTLRRDAYIAYKKVELIADPGKTQAELHRVIENARKAGAAALEAFEKLLASSANPM
jgi:hypothetical protein